MKYVHVALAFLFMFFVSFFIWGYVLRRVIPQGPGTVYNPFALAHWTDNWEGLIAGLIVGGLFARRIYIQQRQEEARTKDK